MIDCEQMWLRYMKNTLQHNAYISYFQDGVLIASRLKDRCYLYQVLCVYVVNLWSIRVITTSNVK